MERITERQIIGEFFKQLAVYAGAPWIAAVSNYFPSDQAGEEYGWLGMVPQLREWIGGRNAKGLRENGMEIKNKHFEATIDILVRHLRRDKTGQAMTRIRDLAKRTISHWAKLLSIMIENGEAGVCYDSLYFFDTTHEEGISGSQSNLLSIDISALPCENHGTTTQPSVEEMQLAIAQTIAAIMSFKDDQGEPMNEDAEDFLIMVPNVMYYQAALNAVTTPMQVSASQTVLEGIKQKHNIQVVQNPRLTWTDSFATFRADSEVKALIRQEETAVQLKIKGEGSEYEFDNDAHQYGVDTWRNVGYGLWQMACKGTLE